MINPKVSQRKRRQIRVRSKIKGDTQKPRLSVFRSKKHIYVQVIDDKGKKTLAGISDLKIKNKKTKTERAEETGKLIAKEIKKLNIKQISFDRGSYKYHGRVKALAEGVRKEGISF